MKEMTGIPNKDHHRNHGKTAESPFKKVSIPFFKTLIFYDLPISLGNKFGFILF
jgi:hypothetical protein